MRLSGAISAFTFQTCSERPVCAPQGLFKAGPQRVASVPLEPTVQPWTQTPTRNSRAWTRCQLGRWKQKEQDPGGDMQ